MAFDLKNKVAIVFGGGCSGDGMGNGKAISIAYALSGAKVVVVDHVLARAEDTVEHIKKDGNEAVCVKADVTNSSEVSAAINFCIEQYGTIDILHNNVALALFGDPIDLSEGDWDKSMAVNLKSVFLACKYALPIMLQNGGGKIVNTSSILSTVTSDYPLYAYNASKAALEQFTKTLAVQYGGQNIRANVVVPGLINTPQIHAHTDIVGSHGGEDETIGKRDAKSPTGKMGKAWDIAWASVFLASEEANYVNAHCLFVDGGLTAKQA